MDSAGQLARFFLCISLGVVGGFLYEAASLLVLPKPKKWINGFRTVADVLYFLSFAVLCVWACNRLLFDGFREYHYLGFALGMILYLKTFHKAVAFFKNLCYNGVRKLANCIKNKKNFRKKEEKRL